MDIASLQNARVKHIVKLREDRKQRRKEGLMLVEGFDEISLALAAGNLPESVFTAPELASRQLHGLRAEAATVTRPVFEKISHRDNPDGWLAIFPIPELGLKDLQLSTNPLLLVAESVEKPGNLGAILRTADAVHADAVLVCDGRTDPYNPNVVRASRGTLFTVPTLEVSSADVLAFLREHKILVVATSPQAEALYTDANLRGAIALAVGAEDEGLSDFWLSHADLQVRIPMLGKVNSLNVSVAAALIAYEALRQRGSQSRQ
jgi:TrmH family RNA methyltransferase